MPSPLVPADAILLDLDAPDREAALAALSTALHGALSRDATLGCDATAFHDALLAREGAGATALGAGFACPHVRLEGLPRLAVGLAALRKPVAWGESESVEWLTLVAAPQAEPAAALKLMGRLAELAQAVETRPFLRQARDKAEVARWLAGKLRGDEAPLTAADIMRTSLGQIGPDTPVPEITQRMGALNLDCAGITDSDRRLLGQVTADDLFTLGMPDFFRQLKSVSFIAEFDPFEKYFSKEAHLKARDVMTKDVAKVPPTATILEIVHLLSVHRYPKVFVVDEADRLLGVIDRIRVVDRLLNL
ncbi:MAG: PTS sugar transporter subunit IIA [Myxococcales bacterium]|nr:PTS sugar transporter subunit IIA [Myxococcales bacterium]